MALVGSKSIPPRLPVQRSSPRYHTFPPSSLLSFLQHHRRSSSSTTNSTLQNNKLHSNGELLQYSYGFTSYFKLPEQGMQDYELLSRSSLIVAKPSNSNFPKKWHFIGPAHVTHPWLYRQLYIGNTYAWLDFVREDAVIAKLEIKKVTCSTNFEINKISVKLI